MFNFFKGKSLEARLSETKLIRIFGVKFRIRKLNALDYLDGSKALIQVYDEYSMGKKDTQIEKSSQIKKHMTDVFMAGVVEPKLSRKKEDNDGLFVDNLFTDMELSNRLYEHIMSFTYGKKKI